MAAIGREYFSAAWQEAARSCTTGAGAAQHACGLGEEGLDAQEGLPSRVPAPGACHRRRGTGCGLDDEWSCLSFDHERSCLWILSR